MITFLVDDVIVHELVDFVQVEKWHHRVAVVLGVVVGVPQERADDDVGAHAAGVAKTVRLLGDLTVGVLEVAEIVDDRVSTENRGNPPEEEGLWVLDADEVDGGGVCGELGESGHLQLLHDATLLAVRPFLETPSRAAVVDRNAHRGEDDAASPALEGVRDVEELPEVGDAAVRDVAKGGVLELLARVVAGELGVLVDVVGVGVVLLVHDLLVSTKFEAEDSCQEETDVVVHLGLEGVAVKELMLSSESEALELEAVEEVQRNEHEELGWIVEDALVEWVDVQEMNGVRGERHDTEVDGQALEAFVVALLHQVDEDSIVEDAITLLTLAVLDVGPVLVVTVDLGKAVGVSLLVEHLGERVFD